MFKKTILNIAEITLDVSRVISAYIFYEYYKSIWLSVLFFIFSVILDSIYIISNIGIDLSTIYTRDFNDITKDIIDNVKEKFWLFFPIRMTIIIGSIVVLDILNRGIHV